MKENRKVVSKRPRLISYLFRVIVTIAFIEFTIKIPEIVEYIYHSKEVIKFIELAKKAPYYDKVRFFIYVFIVGAGYVLFRFKRAQQFWYGALETAFAISNSIYVSGIIRSNMGKDNIQPIIWISGFSTIYLVVRGLSNISDGYKKSFILKGTIDRIFLIQKVPNE